MCRRGHFKSCLLQAGERSDWRWWGLETAALIDFLSLLAVQSEVTAGEGEGGEGGTELAYHHQAGQVHLVTVTQLQSAQSHWGGLEEPEHGVVVEVSADDVDVGEAGEEGQAGQVGGGGVQVGPVNHLETPQSGTVSHHLLQLRLRHGSVTLESFQSETRLAESPGRHEAA